GVIVIAVLVIANQGGNNKSSVNSSSSSTTTSEGATTTSQGATTTAAAGGVPQAQPVPAGEKITDDTPCPKADGSSKRTSSFAKPPTMCIDPAKAYTATFDTTEGTIVVNLDTQTT